MRQTQVTHKESIETPVGNGELKTSGIRTRPLAQVVEVGAPIVYGIVQPGENDASGIPFVQSRDLGGPIDLAKLDRTSKEIAAQYKRSMLQAGDLLFSLRGNIGVSSVAPASLSGANIARGVARIRVRSEFDTHFVWYALQGEEVRERLLKVTNGSTFKEITIDELRKISVPDYSIGEQRKIAEILRTWDRAIESLRTLHKAKKHRFYGMSQRLLAKTRAVGPGITRSLGPPKTFGDVFVERQDKNEQLKSADVVTVGKYAIRKQSEHFKRSVASKDLSNYWIISPGDFVYDPMSAYYGAIGRYCGASDGLVSPAYRVLRLKTSVVPEFMEHLIRSYHIRFLLETRSSQGNKEGKRRLLQRDEFGSIEFFLPTWLEQQEIAETLSLFESDVTHTEVLLSKLESQRGGIMQKLLTGEWRVKV